MKRLRTNSRWARNKYSHAQRVEVSGAGVRRLTVNEVLQLQAVVEQARSGMRREPIRLEVEK